MNMNQELETQDLLTFFQALSDGNRLKIVGLLANQPLTVEQLSAMLHLRPSTVSHHLSQLAKAGLVSATAESYYNVYHFQAQALESQAKRLLQKGAFTSAASGVDMDAYDRKVVRDYSTAEGRLKTIPAQRKKLEVILRHVAQAFEPEVHYREAQVNQILQKFHDDTATLRRELVGAGIFNRTADGGEYWREREPPVEAGGKAGVEPKKGKKK